MTPVNKMEQAIALQQQHGYTLIHAFDDEAIIAGQGTLGLELLQQVPELDVVVISGGNIDMTLLSRILERGLESDGRITRMKVSVALTVLLAGQQVTILGIRQSHAISEVALGEVEVELMLEKGQVAAISEQLQRRGVVLH